ncbi:ATP-dependent zinc metalloprotease FtsH [Acuticoccus sp. M5D2P5]|uniref:ATP-dependent zinc metalloprotease FtsH n=1 Tax=Acuticoccus kalidii TaxID=2910977 RepID=UPI001F1E538A|nr:ATP-dependent zinc metalloprotease FtsH [Acuticoccus kalidii]MCF3934873.1 ATP-dependent zinc metalloprotease FtsH [Acuticoccus kalidii]
MLQREQQIHFWYIVLAILGVVFLRDLWTQYSAVEPIPYSQFETDLAAGSIKDVVVGPDTIRGTYTAPREGRTAFVTTRVDPALAETLRKSNVTFSGQAQNTLLVTILSWILPTLLFFGVWAILVRRMAGGGVGGLMAIGKSRAKIYMETDTKVGFDDVAGVDEAKEELREVIEFLKAPKEYGRLGAHVPKGILLVGPPGTGKTLLARAVAGEAGVPFFSISGSEFVEMFVGVGAARVRDLFEQARQKAPAIIFVDELDALGRARGASQLVGGHDEREQTLNQLLSELDGFDPSVGVVLLAATNRPEVLDPALLRAGRFDRQILVDRPDRLGRIQILNVHLKKLTLASDVDVDTIAGLTTGFSGADLANLVNEAALLATRRRALAVALEDFTGAVERIVAGLEKRNRILNPRERKVVAYHEMGHALVAMALPGADEVHKVSIIPRGIGALGYTIQRPTEDRFLMSREELENKIAVLMGGRAAEDVVFGELSTGAADDLVKATDIARSMAARYGMVEALGNVSYERERSLFLNDDGGVPHFERGYSERTSERLDDAVRAIIDDVYVRTREILNRNADLLHRAAADLLARETLDAAALGQYRAALAPSPATATPGSLLPPAAE